jgi:hypothetical protein
MSTSGPGGVNESDHCHPLSPSLVYEVHAAIRTPFQEAIREESTEAEATNASTLPMRGWGFSPKEHDLS